MKGAPMIKKILLVLLVATVQLQGFSLAFIPSSNYRYADTCSYTSPMCPYGDLLVSFEYKDGSTSTVQTVQCGTVGTVNYDYKKGVPKYIVLKGKKQPTSSTIKFDFALLGKLTPVVTTCDESKGTPKFSLAGIDGSGHAWNVLGDKLRNGIPFGAVMSDRDPVFKKLASCS